jgi:DNA-directed RNA polymerase specialized sigma24 family protein
MSHYGKAKDENTGEMVWKYGYTASEIAYILNCTESAVWQVLARALQKMKRKIMQK